MGGFNFANALQAAVGCLSLVLFIRGFQHFDDLDDRVSAPVSWAIFGAWAVVVVIAVGLS